MKRQHPDNPGLFWCNRCKNYKEKSEFHKSKTYHGIYGFCKACCGVVSAIRQKKDVEGVARRNKKYRATKKGKETASVYRRKYKKDNPDYHKKREQKERSELSDSYIRRIIKQRKDEAIITSSLIEMVRLEVLGRRTLSEFKRWRGASEFKQEKFSRVLPGDNSYLWCPQCRCYKKRECYNIDRHNKKYGLAAYCKECNKINKRKQFKQWRRDNESSNTDVQGKQHADEADHEGRISG
jgi:hypothetical protein